MSSGRYTATAVALHWLVAALIAGAFAIGLYMHDLPLSPQKLKLYSWHKWTGVTIFALVALRLIWRLGHPPPPLPAGLPVWQRRAAHALHLLLYVLMFLIPLTGWLMSSAFGVQTVYFGVLPIPDLLPENEAVAEALRTVHKTLNFALLALVTAHIGAAIKHHLVDRDEVLLRMLPRLRQPSPRTSQRQSSRQTSSQGNP